VTYKFPPALSRGGMLTWSTQVQVSLIGWWWTRKSPLPDMNLL